MEEGIWRMLSRELSIRIIQGKMKMRFLCALFVSVFLCSCLCTAFAADETKAPKLPEQKIKPGNLSGSIADNKGNKLSGKKIEIVDADGKVVGKAVSDRNGLYRITDIPEGDYTLKVDGESVSQLSVTKTATISTMSIALPAGATLLPVSWTVIGVGGTALAVGVPVIANNRSGSSDSGHHPPPPDPVSP
jgi:hypothetical protein